MHSPEYGDDLKKLFPIVEPKLSDSGIVDNVLEFLCFTGQRSLPEVRSVCVVTSHMFSCRNTNAGDLYVVRRSWGKIGLLYVYQRKVSENRDFYT